MKRIFWMKQEHPEDTAAVAWEKDDGQILMHNLHRLSPFLHHIARRPRPVRFGIVVASLSEAPLKAKGHMSFLMELVVNIVAEATGEAALRNRKPGYFPEGNANASLGAVAAFAGSLALIFAIPVLLFTAYADQFTTTDRAGLFLASLLVAALGYGGRRAGMRTPQVTSRNLILARFGTFVASLATGMALVAAIGYTLRLIMGML